jgi:transposase, IS30 family
VSRSRGALRPAGNAVQGVQRQPFSDDITARPRPARLARPGRLRILVLRMLRKRFSPQQIAATLRIEYADQPEMQVSHETIYHAIYVQSRGSLRALLRSQIGGSMQA